MADYEAVIGLECHVELSTRDEDVLRLPRTCSAPPPNTQRLPGVPRASGHAPGPERRGDRAGSSRSASRSTPRSRRTRCSTGRTTSIRTCRRTSRSASTTCRSASTAISTSSSPTAPTRRIGITRVHMEEDTGKSTHGGALRPDPRRRPTRCSTTTAPACRSSSVSASPTCAAPRRPPPTCASCARPWSPSTCPTSRWRRGRCGATRTCRCDRPAPRRSARRSRSRT